MATTDLELKPEGSLPPPGPIGRAFRLILGVACLFYVVQILQLPWFDKESNRVAALLWNGILPALFLVSYVVNIGFSLALKKWPAILSALLLAASAVWGYMAQGQFETPLLANVLALWLLYVFIHLGVSFVLSALLATPGCEMRAIPHLLAKLRGISSKEHHCPVGPISHIDRWERERQ